MKRRIRVLVIDDSAFSRRSITRMLDGFGGISVVGYAVNGEEGIRKVIELKPDVVTLDLDMPGMDGFALLRILKTRFLAIRIVIVSALSGTDDVFKALEQGAVDFVPKPSGLATEGLMDIQEALRQNVLHAANALPRRGRASVAVKSADDTVQSPHGYQEAIYRLEAPHLCEIIAIGASTGGPPALQQILSSFEQRLPCAIVVAQHMPAGFTRAFAERLDRASPFQVREAADGDLVAPGSVLVAPGGMNLQLEVVKQQVFTRVVSPSPNDRYAPSVDVLFDSCAAIYGRRMMAVILTGMGNDGSRGVTAVKRRGGFVVAESEKTAVVYGMPREAAATGLVDRVLPLEDVAREIVYRSVLP